MSYPGMPAPRFIETNGIRMALYEAGPPSPQAPPLVLCHGFPEIAFSWRHQLRDLAKHGLRVIAPDMRGYGATDAPAKVEDYDMEHLTGDLVGLLDALDIEKAVFVGHDWGGLVTWRMGIMHPARVAGLIGLNTPFIPRPPVEPIALWRERLGEEMYIVHFQKPGEADAIFARSVENTMDFMMRGPMPGATPSAGFATRRDGDASVFPLVRIVDAYDPARDPRPRFLTDAEQAVFVETFKRTGFTGGINWYRNFTRNWERSAGEIDHIAVPALMIMAELDAVLSPSMADGMERYVPNLEKHLILGSGHWTQQEKPAEVTALIADWMSRTFPG
ncbi:MAG: alpha/beta hydrolase [Hyphomonadaceae bacterium]|nr:alpha/beta hydrolase [Hyphomonadaceae bacterium]